MSEQQQRATDDECYLSSSFTQRCVTDEDGKLKCEALKRKFRHCPGREREEIERSTHESTEDKPGPLSVFGGGQEQGLRHPGPEINGMMSQMDALFNALFFSSGVRGAFPPVLGHPPPHGDDRTDTPRGGARWRWPPAPPSAEQQPQSAARRREPKVEEI